MLKNKNQVNTFTFRKKILRFLVTKPKTFKLAHTNFPSIHLMANLRAGKLEGDAGFVRRVVWAHGSNKISGAREKEMETGKLA
jgi:hypothetical protein